MKTYFSDIIPKFQRFSEKLDNLTLLTNQHWVVIDEIENAKNVYIFRSNNDLLISQNGKVEKAKWEYIGNNSILIDKKDESYLFKHGFFDENILALKIDGKDEYAFLINENKFDGELNSIDKVTEFLNRKYIEPQLKNIIQDTTGIVIEKQITRGNNKNIRFVDTRDGYLEIHTRSEFIEFVINDEVFLNGTPAPDGKYRLNWFEYIVIKNGRIETYRG